MDLKTLFKAKDHVIPGSGFNLVGLDEDAKPSEALYIISHHTTEREVDKAKTEYAKENPGVATYIYSPKDR